MAKIFIKQVIKYVGAAYLIYLGIKTLLKQGELTLNEKLEPAQLQSVFWQGVLTNLFNPKAILFFMAFLPQFVNPEFEPLPTNLRAPASK